MIRMSDVQFENFKIAFLLRDKQLGVNIESEKYPLVSFKVINKEGLDFIIALLLKLGNSHLNDISGTEILRLKDLLEYYPIYFYIFYIKEVDRYVYRYSLENCADNLENSIQFNVSDLLKGIYSKI